jgi:hypothetical protein
MATDNRPRIPVEPAYTEALGLAVYAFARLEWNAVWCCERLKPNYVRTLGRKTAGKIGENLQLYAKTIADQPLQADCASAADEFMQMVKLRNAIVHGKPGTAPYGDQRLFNKGQSLSIADLYAAADAFTRCGARLNELLHGPLKLLSETQKG